MGASASGWSSVSFNVRAVFGRFSHVGLSVTHWTAACQVPGPLGFSRHEYLSGLPCPPPGDLPDPGIEPASLTSSVLAGELFTTGATWETQKHTTVCKINNKILSSVQ